MTLRLDPRADLVAPVFDHRAFQKPPRASSDYKRRTAPAGSLPSQPRPCYDWIFSSASNVHVAIDRSSFKEYRPFRTYVLAVADNRRIPVKGIGTVELKIRKSPGSKESHKVLLEPVLYIPSWLCNILSDVHFTPAADFEHTWAEFRVTFQQLQEGKMVPWGYTESFCGLDRMVLHRQTHGRSPMTEDKDREVYSVNINWPQHQRDKWDLLLSQEESRVVAEMERKTSEQPQTTAPQPTKDTAATTALTPADANLPKRSLRPHSLRLPGKTALRDVLAWRKSMET
jgi:hypothetical protein